MLQQSKSTQTSSSSQSTSSTSPIEHKSPVNKLLKRKTSLSPSRHSLPSLSRGSSYLSETDYQSGIKWTREHWKKLYEYYMRKNRDIEEAAKSFYYCEAVVHVISTDSTLSIKELWPREKILWYCRCLDTRWRYQRTLSYVSKQKKSVSDRNQNNRA
ncbi:hypothetical protein AB4K20DRAFT_1902850 [Rhizopus microsporus]|uniref:Uncharacterized protein n=1 Tax=Rhizopus microsporus TaxID=58291 RepID=A0A1X0RN13_RHIZD|nr:hypothetical protein BCV71DRAFT_67513 [Rhizopus microsporus]